MSDPGIRLRKAIKENNYFIASRLLKRFPDLLDNIDPANGWSNLHYSSYHNNYQISELLLKNIHSRFLKTVSKLSDQNFSSHPKNPDSSLYNQITDEDEIKLSFDKQTVLHVACLGDSADTLSLLLSYFNVCIDQRDKNGLTPSHICCIQGFPNSLLVLLKNGAYPNLQDNEGDTPLHKAFQFAYLKCIKLLLQYNADDQLYNNVGWKPQDVAFSTELIQEYKNIKSNISKINSNDNISNSLIKIPQSKQKYQNQNQNQNQNQSQNLKIPLNTNNISFTSSSHNINGINNNNSNNSNNSISTNNNTNISNRINLPSIQPRKYSLSSLRSDEYLDKFDNDYTNSIISTTSSRNSSPIYTSNNTIFTSKKSPSDNSFIKNNISNKKFQQPSSDLTPNQLPSPRRSTISNYAIHNESPTSKRSSLSTRTFRSNSQLSELSPIKSENILIQQNSGSSLLSKSGLTTPRNSFLDNFRSNSTYPIPLQVEEASSKLQDFKLKNVDRLKLDTKLGNIINNTPQDNLTSPSTSIHSYHDNNDLKPTTPIETNKRSKILSIPISSARARRNSTDFTNI